MSQEVPAQGSEDRSSYGVEPDNGPEETMEQRDLSMALLPVRNGCLHEQKQAQEDGIEPARRVKVDRKAQEHARQQEPE